MKVVRLLCFSKKFRSFLETFRSSNLFHVRKSFEGYDTGVKRFVNFVKRFTHFSPLAPLKLHSSSSICIPAPATTSNSAILSRGRGNTFLNVSACFCVTIYLFLQRARHCISSNLSCFVSSVTGRKHEFFIK